MIGRSGRIMQTRPQTSIHGLHRMAGVAALLGGGARVAASFIPWSPGDASLEALYAAIDMLLLLGLFGVYARKAAVLGPVGLIGFVAATCALSLIGGPDADPFGVSTYRVGASILSVAMALFGVVALVRRAMPPWAPICWLASLGAGLASTGADASGSFMAAGVLFGAGFVAAGLELATSRP